MLKFDTLSEVQTHLFNSYLLNEPVFMQGSPGIGKSQSVFQVAEKLKKHLNRPDFVVIDMRLAQMDPSDIMGIPFPGDDGRTHWLPPSSLPKDGKLVGFLFLDELNLAAQAIQNAAYQLIHDRRTGEYLLPKGFVPIAAGNKKGEGAVQTMYPALRSRFSWCEVPTPSIEEWTDWALTHDVHPTILAYINFNPSKLFVYDRKHIDEMAFPNPRSWVKASKYLRCYSDATGASILDYKMAEKSISSVVGAIAIDFISFTKLRDQLKIEDILKNPDKAEIPEDLSIRFALVSSIGSMIRASEPSEKKIDEKVFRAFLTIAKRLSDESGKGIELAVLLLRMGKTDKVIEKLMKNKEWLEDLGPKLSKVLL